METVTEEIKPIPTPKLDPFDRIKIRCGKCGHRYAIRKNIITNIREATYNCEFCGRIVRG